MDGWVLPGCIVPVYISAGRVEAGGSLEKKSSRVGCCGEGWMGGHCLGGWLLGYRPVELS